MARIVCVRDARDVLLNGRTLVGRAAGCGVVLTSHGASKEHASVAWDGACWVLRDLGSRNGTRINNTPLANREWRLALHDRIAFGDPAELWEWADGTAPCPFATATDGTRIWGSPTLLVLPDETSPLASLYARDSGWQLDVGEEQRPVKDGERLILEGQTLELHLPDLTHELLRTRTLVPLPRFSSCTLDFSVSADEEHVGVRIHIGSHELELPPRVFWYTLLTLARIRDAELCDGISDADAGWIDTNDLARQLKSAPEKVNVDVHRLRQVVSRLKLFEDPENIVERRNRQVRVGTRNVMLGRG